jgi:hypothetical protein
MGDGSDQPEEVVDLAALMDDGDLPVPGDNQADAATLAQFDGDDSDGELEATVDLASMIADSANDEEAGEDDPALDETWFDPAGDPPDEADAEVAQDDLDLPVTEKDTNDAADPNVGTADDDLSFGSTTAGADEQPDSHSEAVDDDIWSSAMAEQQSAGLESGDDESPAPAEEFDESSMDDIEADDEQQTELSPAEESAGEEIATEDFQSDPEQIEAGQSEEQTEAALTGIDDSLVGISEEEVILIDEEVDDGLSDDQAEEGVDAEPAAGLDDEEAAADRLFAVAAETADSDIARPGDEIDAESLADLAEYDQGGEPDQPGNDETLQRDAQQLGFEELTSEKGDDDSLVEAASAEVAEFEQVESPDDELRPVRSSRWWLVGHVALTMVLLALVGGELLYLLREPLRDHPTIRPWQESLCSVVGCELPKRRDTEKLGAIAKVVISHPKFRDALRIDLSLQNRANFAQPFPTIRILFLDQQDRPVAGRDFAPADYLVGPLSDKTVAQPMVPEQIVLEIKDPGPEAVNYRFSYH